MQPAVGNLQPTMPSSYRAIRSIACAAVLLGPACVIPLADRNSPAKNGAVTGPAANCAAETPVGEGAPGGEAAPKFVGRFHFLPDAPGQAEFDWSGNYITARFTGTDRIRAKLYLPPDPSNVVHDQVFTFKVDDLEPTTRRITVKTDPVTKQPTLEPLEDYDVTGLTPGDAHEVTIYRNTEAQKGAIVFKGFELGPGGSFLPPTRRPRRIEFIGDSIVCGYGNEGKNATCPFEVDVRTPKDAQGKPILGANGKPVVVTVPVTENQYRSFTAITARELDADAVTVCWSGKGVYKNYKERTVIDPETKQVVFEEDTLTTVPQLWASRTVASNPGEGYKWDFSQEKPEDIPQVVFISLGTNDFARDTKPQSTDPAVLPGDNVPDGDMNDVNERQKFYQTYLEFVREVRARRPAAHIFIATPPMVTDQFPLDNARRNLKAILLSIVDAQQKAGDTRVYQMDLVEQGFRYGLGCDYHPNLEVHRIMAEQLVGAIRSKTCW